MRPIIHRFNVTITRLSDGTWLATVPDVKGCGARAMTREEVIVRVQKAIKRHLSIEWPEVIKIVVD